MKLLSQTRQAGPLAGPVLPFLFLLVMLAFASPIALGQKAEQARVIDSILGVGIGTSLEEAHAKLDRLRTRKSRESRAEREEENEEREGGRKEAWALKATDYSTVALQADREGRVVWITGFVRPGEEIPFAKLGDLSSAVAVTDTRAIWNVVTPGVGYRLVAKGKNRKAGVVTLLSLASTRVQ
ncbi:MAG: hypothetical protein ABJB61_15105 [bacterium]